jgi:hypothetical protein
MNEDLSREELFHVVDRVVEEFLEDAGISEPPVDAVDLAIRHLRLPPPRQKSRPARGEEDVSAEDHSPVEQKHWSAAQQIGVHFKPILLERLGVDSEQGRTPVSASLANLFARHLLTPTSWFAADARAVGYDIPALKSRFATAGIELVAWRLLDLGESCIITVVDNDHVTRRKSNSWPVRRELMAAERECQRYVHHYSRPRVVQVGAWTVQGWPLHRPDWKREILRSVGDASCAFPNEAEP